MRGGGGEVARWCALWSKLEATGKAWTFGFLTRSSKDLRCLTKSYYLNRCVGGFM